MVQFPAATPADRVTVVRAALVGVVGVLTLGALRGGPPHTWLVVGLAVVALLLDGVDGWVARRTRTATASGARFDMEVDAVLILVLSGYVAREVGTWVLLIGLARYAFAALASVLPWLRSPIPSTYWRKAVAVFQGVALVVAASGVLPPAWVDALLALALGLLTYSFASQAWWAWRHRAPGPVVVPAALTVVAVLVVWWALTLPDDLGALGASAVLRLPVELLVILCLGAFLPARTRVVVATAVGLLLGLLALGALMDLAFLAALDRRFDPLQDWGYAPGAYGLLRDSVGPAGAISVAVVASLAAAAVLVGLPWSVRRLTGAAHRHRAALARALPAALGVWVLAAVLGLQVAPGVPVAAANAVSLARDQVHQVRSELAERRQFGAAVSSDPYRDISSRDLLGALRGKDVLLVFVESYGRSAPEAGPEVGAVLDSGTRDLRAAGFSARSAYLTSPTFGGISWLAHATLQSGLWVDSQHRYDDLLASDRLTLSAAFGRAGWRTVDVVPSNTEAWPQGASFYRFDRIYGAGDLGYAGPSFGYATMPDQYVLAALARLELAAVDRRPVMAEVDLVSSHTPWAPVPTLVPWSAVGDGSVFDDMPNTAVSADQVWRDTDRVRAAYARSIAYSLQTVVSFAQTHLPDAVIVLLGDHQPATVVTGRGARHDVPISLITRDPAVLERIADWGWTPGLRPGGGAPVWRMDAFRDRFLSAFAAA